MNTKNNKVCKITHLGNIFSLLEYNFSLIFNKYVFSDKQTVNAFSLMNATSTFHQQTELLSSINEDETEVRFIDTCYTNLINYSACSLKLQKAYF